MDKKLSASRGLCPTDPQQGLCRCASGPHWGLPPQTPVIGSSSALAKVQQILDPSLSVKKDSLYYIFCVCQFKVLAELDVQPFGISVCEESNRIVVTCSTPLRQAMPFVSKSSRLLVYLAASGHLQHDISLDDSYEIPRHALAVGQHFVVCHGWNKYGKVAKEFHSSVASVLPPLLPLLLLWLLLQLNFVPTEQTVFFSGVTPGREFSTPQEG